MPYATLAQIRALGVPGNATTDVTDATINTAIEVASAIIDRVTRQWFEPRSGTFRVDGNSTDTLFLPVPIIALDSLYINNDFTNLIDPSQYVVYSGNGLIDDRRNPRVVFAAFEPGDIFTSPILFGPLRFRRGRQNQQITGTFGFVETIPPVPPATEPTYATPVLINRACILLTLAEITSPLYGTSVATAGAVIGLPPGAIVEEQTDGHSIRYAEGAGATYTARRTGLSGLIKNPEVMDILSLYKAPMKIASPTDWVAAGRI